MPKEIRVTLLGHKDHGKSTLIGRILHDTGSITDDRIAEAKSVCTSLGKDFEYAFLLDSFVEEREGGFTLDTTCAQARHKDAIYNLIDVPGHKELVRNMLSGASMADAAVLIVSAREGEGLQDETRLHIYLARLLGIKRIVVAINKMDAAGYGEAVFNRIRTGLAGIMAGFGFDSGSLSFIPISASRGDNVMRRSESMPWYGGEPLMAHLESFAGNAATTDCRRLPPRLIVQDVYDGGAMAVGRIECGELRAGQEIMVHPGGHRAAVRELRGREGPLSSAGADSNVGILADPAVPWRRGSVCVDASDAATPRDRIEARIFCLPEGRISVGERLILSCGPQESQAQITRIRTVQHPIRDKAPRDGAEAVGASEAAEVEIALESGMVLDAFSHIPRTGRFILSLGSRTAAVGVVL